MFPMTITLSTPAQLNAVLAALRPDLQASDFKDPAVGAAYVEVKDRIAKREDAPEKPAPAAHGKGAPAADAKPTAEAAKADAPETKAEPSVSYDDVKKAILEVSKTKGREAAIALLGKFGAAKGPDLQDKPETFAPFVQAARELVS